MTLRDVAMQEDTTIPSCAARCSVAANLGTKAACFESSTSETVGWPVPTRCANSSLFDWISPRSICLEGILDVVDVVVRCVAVEDNLVAQPAGVGLDGVAASLQLSSALLARIAQMVDFAAQVLELVELRF